MRVIFEMEKRKEREKKNTQVEAYTKVTLRMDRSMDRESLFLLMAVTTWEIFKKVYILCIQVYRTASDYKWPTLKVELLPYFR